MPVNKMLVLTTYVQKSCSCADPERGAGIQEHAQLKNHKDATMTIFQ